MTGETIKAILEDVADNLFNPDPYYQQGGDMVRVGGMGFTINVDARDGRAHQQHAPAGDRGAPIEAGKDYVVAGWASVNEDTAGPADLGRGGRASQGPRGRAAASRGQTVKFVRAGN